MKEKTGYMLRTDKEVWRAFMDKLEKNHDKAQRILQLAIEDYLKERGSDAERDYPRGC